MVDLGVRFDSNLSLGIICEKKLIKLMVY